MRNDGTEAFEFVFWGREGGRDEKLTEPIRVNAQIELVNNTDDDWHTIASPSNVLQLC